MVDRRVGGLDRVAMRCGVWRLFWMRVLILGVGVVGLGVVVEMMMIWLVWKPVLNWIPRLNRFVRRDRWTQWANRTVCCGGKDNRPPQQTV